MNKAVLFALILLSSFRGFAMDCSVKELRPLIYANEFDEDLEMNESSNLKNSVASFNAKGGTLKRMDGDASPFQFEAGDVVFPACSGANNRSQTLWALLRPYDGVISLQLPHATRYGFDPYNGRTNWERSFHFYDNDEFVKWAGCPKSKKFGWDSFKDWLSKGEASISELAMMTEYYNTHYYNPTLPVGTRRIYIAFAKNAHVHLHRLSQTNISLENVIVLFFPIEDIIAKPVSELETPPRSIKAYQKLASILEKYLDFSRLQTIATH